MQYSLIYLQYNFKYNSKPPLEPAFSPPLEPSFLPPLDEVENFSLEEDEDGGDKVKDDKNSSFIKSLKQKHSR